jgi:hypothetical protein
MSGKIQHLRRHDWRTPTAPWRVSMSLLAFFIASSASFGLVGLGFVEVVAADGGVGQHGHAVGCTSRMPPATKTNSSSPPLSAISMRTAPGLMRVISGVWRGRMPSSPFRRAARRTWPRREDALFGGPRRRIVDGVHVERRLLS